ESLTEIARRYGMPIKKLAQANSLNRKTKVVVGAKLSIPGTN
ncbi:MAG: LysM peptidoglycan-binding domain-containing protein, partial [Proteobacteria bacterium]